MSTALVDLGNTRWKLGLSAPDAPQVIAQGDHNDLQRLTREIAQSGVGIEQIIFASVAESALTERVLDSLCQQTSQVRQVFSTDHFPGLVVGYDDPGQLGVDRALAMLAVRSQWSGPFCVIDAGTAVTIDFVDGHGRHLGGFILPGRALARECLLRGTAIPGDETTNEFAMLGRDTAGAVALGARYAVCGVVRHVLALPEMQAFVEAGCTFVGGGDAASLLTLLPPPAEQMDQPVLQGLNRLSMGSRA